MNIIKKFISFFKKDRLKTAKNIYPHDILYSEYTYMCKDKKKKPVSKYEYRQAVSKFLFQENINLIYALDILDKDTLEKLATGYNIAQFTFKDQLMVSIIPWYDYKEKAFKITSWD